jgi:hypothetical protein
MSVAGLQEGVAQDMKINCAADGDPTASSTTATNTTARGHHNAIPFSCDTFFYMLGDKLGIDTIAKYATAFGYGQKTGIDLPGETAGLMPSAQWKMKNYHQLVSRRTLDVAIGQGAVEATPLQLARIIGGIASGGHLVRPHVVSPISFPPTSARPFWRAFPARATQTSPRSRHLDHHHRRHGRRHHHRHRRGRAHGRASTLPARRAPPSGREWAPSGQSPRPPAASVPAPQSSGQDSVLHAGHFMVDPGPAGPAKAVASSAASLPAGCWPAAAALQGRAALMRRF